MMESPDTKLTPEAPARTDGVPTPGAATVPPVAPPANSAPAEPGPKAPASSSAPTSSGTAAPAAKPGNVAPPAGENSPGLERLDVPPEGSLPESALERARRSGLSRDIARYWQEMRG